MHSRIFLTKRLITLIAITIIGAVPVASALAHSIGQTLEKNVGTYLVDVGYDAIAQIEVGQPVRFDFRLLNNTSKEFVPFTSAWAKFSVQEQVVFSAPVAKNFGLTGLTLTFPQAGQYTLEVTYYSQDKELVSTTFPLTVIRAQDDQSFPASDSLLLAGALGMLLGILFWHFYLTRKSIKNL